MVSVVMPMPIIFESHYLVFIWKARKDDGTERDTRPNSGRPNVIYWSLITQLTYLLSRTMETIFNLHTPLLCFIQLMVIWWWRWCGDTRKIEWDNFYYPFEIPRHSNSHSWWEEEEQKKNEVSQLNLINFRTLYNLCISPLFAFCPFPLKLCAFNTILGGDEEKTNKILH